MLNNENKNILENVAIANAVQLKAARGRTSSSDLFLAKICTAHRKDSYIPAVS